MKRRLSFYSLLLIALFVCSGCSMIAGSKPETISFLPQKDFLSSASTVSLEEENILGRAVAARILGIYKPVTDEKLTSYITHVGLTVAASSPQPQTFAGYTFIVLDTDEVNAMSTPGGIIFISKGLLKRLKNEDELASVLAHEVTHVTKKHGLLAIKPNHFPSFLEIGGKALSAIDCTGLASQTAQLFEAAVEDVFSALLASGYAKEQEYEADAGALLVSNQAGYKSESLDDVLASLESLPGKRGWFSTHPAPQSRRKNITMTFKPSPNANEGFKNRQKRFLDFIEKLPN